jgi:hypothetical protein
VAGLKARDESDPRLMSIECLPHVETLQIGQQTELGRKRLELVSVDLKQRGFWSNHDPIASTITHRAL